MVNDNIVYMVRLTVKIYRNLYPAPVGESRERSYISKWSDKLEMVKKGGSPLQQTYEKEMATTDQIQAAKRPPAGSCHKCTKISEINIVPINRSLFTLHHLPFTALMTSGQYLTS